MRNSAGEEHEFVFSETKPGRESATDVIRVDAREAEMRQIGQVRGKLVLQQEAEAVAEKIGERTQAMERSKKEVHAQVITNAPSPAARAVVKKTSKRPGSTGPGPGPGRVSPLPRAADAVNLRSRLVHLLARQPQTRTDLELRLKIPQRDAQLTALLDEVAVRMADGYDLQPEGFKEVQIFTWPAYAAADRSEVLRRAHAAFDKIGLSSKDRKPYVEQPVPTYVLGCHGNGAPREMTFTLHRIASARRRSPVAPKRGDPAPPTIVTGPAPKRVRTVSKPGAGAGTGASRKAAGKKQGKGPLDISSDAQYERRRREFDNKYAVYTELYAKLQANQTAFNEKKRALDNARNMHGAASREAREIEDAIRDMHASVKEVCRRCNALVYCVGGRKGLRTRCGRIGPGLMRAWPNSGRRQVGARVPGVAFGAGPAQDGDTAVRGGPPGRRLSESECLSNKG
jgi:hypothetical protein